MNNSKIREGIRRVIKYLILLLVVSFSVISIPSKCAVHNSEAFYIGVIAATMYAVIEMISPSIMIKL
tara:strand:- start:7386 stop:7586 length:201 start_codon:yes stop_codon:yes gene_type:complete